MPTLKLTFWGDAEQVASSAARVDAFCRDAALAETTRFRLGVCLLEALNNVVEHGDADGSPGPIELVCRLGSATLTVRISDAGGPLDEIPGETLPEGLAESGRGWPILHRWLDGIGYRRRDGLNRLYLVMRIGQQA